MNTPCSTDHPVDLAQEHKHLCFSCGSCWRHGNDLRGDVEAHTCPGCGIEVWDKWHFLNDRKAA